MPRGKNSRNDAGRGHFSFYSIPSRAGPIPRQLGRVGAQWCLQPQPVSACSLHILRMCRQSSASLWGSARHWREQSPPPRIPDKRQPPPRPLHPEQISLPAPSGVGSCLRSHGLQPWKCMGQAEVCLLYIYVYILFLFFAGNLKKINKTNEKKSARGHCAATQSPRLPPH